MDIKTARVRIPAYAEKANSCTTGFLSLAFRAHQWELLLGRFFCHCECAFTILGFVVFNGLAAAVASCMLFFLFV